MTPKDWRMVRLAEIADYKAGRTPSRDRPDYWREDSGSVPWVAISDMKEFETLRTTKERISETAFQQVFRGIKVPAGALIMSFKLTIGRVATLGIDACHNEAIISINPKGEVDQRFLAYALSQVDYDSLQDRQIKGNTLNQEKLDRIGISLPPFDEQSHIANILDHFRDGISLQDQSLDAAQDLKRAAMRDLFTRGLRGEAQKETEIGLVPESWDVMSCEDGVEAITVGVVVKPASYYVQSGIPAFRSLNVKEDRIDASNLVYFSERDSEISLAKSRLRTGDVLVVRTGYPGTSCVVPPEFEGANCIDLVIVRPKQHVIRGEFLSRYLNSESGRAQALSNSHGLAQQHLNVGAVRRLRIPVPPTIDEQRDIVTILDTIDQKIDLHRRKRAVLDDLFKALLHKLMTGEIRVADLDLSALASTTSADAAA
jgi:type I restriction enzyme, S subunit